MILPPPLPTSSADNLSLASRLPLKLESVEFRVSSARIRGRFCSRKRYVGFGFSSCKFRSRLILQGCASTSGNTGGGNPNLKIEIGNLTRKGAKSIVIKRFSDELDENKRELVSSDRIQLGSGASFASFQEDPIVDKLRTQLGVIHPLPSPPPISRNVLGLFVFFFFVGIGFDKIWTRVKRARPENRGLMRPQLPASFSTLLENDLQRKESVEWVNMVLGKLWKGYKGGLENWLVGLLQPVIDDLKKPDYVERVEVKQFSLGDEALSVRSVERRTSRGVNDLQYQIGLRYTGGARMLLMLSLKFGIFPIAVPVGVRDFDIDGELWVKLRLIPTEPWVGAVSWAFVALPKIKFELSPFRLFNLMAIPVLSMFLTKLLTEDLPRLFVRPNKIVLDFQKGEAVGPVPVANDFKSGEINEKNKDYRGELSVTLVDACNLPYMFYGKTDPYVVLSIGDQIIRSKKNSQTTVIGPPGEPIWNQDFHMLVSDPRKQKLIVQVKESLGFADVTVGAAEIDLGTLQDTVPTDRTASLRGGWGLLRRGNCGEVLLRLTYKGYVEDEEDDSTVKDPVDPDVSDDEVSAFDVADSASEPLLSNSYKARDKESFMDVLAALLVSEEFQGIVASETGNPKLGDDKANTVSTTARTRTRSPASTPSETDSNGGVSTGSVLIWLSIVTGFAVLTAINIGGSSLFNP